MNKNKKYQCLVYATNKNPDGKVLIWGGDKAASQICVHYDIPFAKIYSTGTLVYDKNKNKWQILNLNPLFNGYFRLSKDESLIYKKIEQMEVAIQKSQALKNKNMDR